MHFNRPWAPRGSTSFKFVSLFSTWSLLFWSTAVFSASSTPVYVNNLSIQAASAMEKIASRDPKKLQSELELREWARARLAWIALKRLQGRDTEAIVIFEGCGEFCQKHGPEKEWLAQKEWGCQKKREANPCLSLKTKAQKPPR